MKREQHRKPGLKELEIELEEQKRMAADFKETAQRVQAEFENYGKRAEMEKQSFREFANAKLIEEFLPLLDSFDSAIEKIGKHKSISIGEAVEGISSLQKQLLRILEKNGLKRIEAEGNEFDPNLHECMLKEKIEGKEDEVVLEELQKGYLLKEKVLRPSKVKINKLEERKEENKGRTGNVV